MPIQNILVVDDSPTDRQHLTDMLAKNGYKVTTAENAEDAFAKVKQFKPDLVLMDIVMPGQNGFQATRELSKNESTKHIPVIICTTKGQETDKVWGMRQGAQDYIVKPVNQADLLAKIFEARIMAEKLSLRDYQHDLVQRLRSTESGRIASRLGVQAGSERWLVDLADADEVVPVPEVSAVPLTRPWFKGVASIRGNLYSVVDFPAFLGGTAVAVGEQARLLLIGARFRMGSALLIDRSLGLLSPERLQLRTGAKQSAWLKAEYDDADGNLWKELDMAQLVAHPDFMVVAA